MLTAFHCEVSFFFLQFLSKAKYSEIYSVYLSFMRFAILLKSKEYWLWFWLEAINIISGHKSQPSFCGPRFCHYNFQSLCNAPQMHPTAASQGSGSLAIDLSAFGAPSGGKVMKLGWGEEWYPSPPHVCVSGYHLYPSTGVWASGPTSGTIPIVLIPSSRSCGCWVFSQLQTLWLKEQQLLEERTRGLSFNLEKD